MLIVAIEEARPGMMLAAPVTHPDHPGQDLLKRGYILEDPIIARLREINIATVYVDYPSLDELDRHLAGYLSPARQQIFQQIKQSMSETQRKTSPSLPYADYANTTRDLITTLLSQGRNPVYLTQMSRLGSDSVGHATAVAHLSLMLGLKLERYLIEQRKRLPAQHAREVVNVGLAGMLHDIGKVKLPAEAQGYSGAEPPEDNALRREWETHPRLGYDLIHNEVEPTAASAVLHHHQHFDGTGFPLARSGEPESKLEGHRIHIFPRIIQAADLYDRLSASIRTPIKRSNVEVLHLMRTTYAGWTDPVVLDALSAVAPPFPPGSKVGLSDGSSAVVIQVDPLTPYKPSVRRFASDGLTLDTNTLDLRAENSPSVQTVGGVNVAPWLVSSN